MILGRPDALPLPNVEIIRWDNAKLDTVSVDCGLAVIEGNYGSLRPSLRQRINRDGIFSWRLCTEEAAETDNSGCNEDKQHNKNSSASSHTGVSCFDVMSAKRKRVMTDYS
jgi:hypothetical protein